MLIARVTEDMTRGRWAPVLMGGELLAIQEDSIRSEKPIQLARLETQYLGSNPILSAVCDELPIFKRRGEWIQGATS